MDTKHDVVVAGGGPAGIGAAIAAARNGAKTLLVEGTNCLGGMLTNGLVGMIRTAGDGGGIIHEFWQRLMAVDGAKLTDSHCIINPCVARVVAIDMVQEAGATILFHALAEGVEMEGGDLKAVYVACKAGRQRMDCGMAVDATGDGDLAVWAGVPHDKGRKGDGYLQAVSLNFELVGVDMDKRPTWDDFQALCKDALERGDIELPPPSTTLHFGHQYEHYPKGYVRFQYDMATHIDASDAESLTQGEILCHQRVFKIWRFLRTHVEAYKNCQIANIATYLGVRETRRIRGEKTLCEDDVLQARKLPDGISRCSWYMDLHDGQKKHPMKEYRAARRPPEGDFYEISYGCLVPQQVDGLLVSGRCISSTRPANGSLRLQPTCMNLGQAAGTAAALCVERSIQPRALAGEELRGILKDQGMEL